MHCFVYGTLKRGFPNHYLIENKENGQAKFVGNASTVDKYPLVVACTFKIPFLLDKVGEGRRVIGEVWEVDTKMGATLDELENHPKLYTREEIEVTLEDGKMDKCQVYMLHNYKPELNKLPFIEQYTQDFVKEYTPKSERGDDIAGNIHKEVKI